MMAPSALPSSWKRPPGRRSPLSGRNQRRTRPGSVQASQTSGTGARNWRRSSTTCAGASCRCPWATVRLQWSSSVMRSRMSVSPGSLIRAAVAASCQLGLQRVEALAPLPAQVGEPAFDADKRGAVEGVEAAGAFGADVGESALPQDTQLTRDSGLGESELRPHDIDHLASGALARGQQLEDAPPDGITENVECLHDKYNIRIDVYMSWLNNGGAARQSDATLPTSSDTADPRRPVDYYLGRRAHRYRLHRRPRTAHQPKPVNGSFLLRSGSLHQRRAGIPIYGGP